MYMGKTETNIKKINIYLGSILVVLEGTCIVSLTHGLEKTDSQWKYCNPYQKNQTYLIKQSTYGCIIVYGMDGLCD